MESRIPDPVAALANQEGEADSPSRAPRVRSPESERKQLNLEWLINSIDGIVWEGKPQSLEFTFVSRQAERLLGYPVEQWYGPTFWIDHLHPDDREWAPKFCQTEVTAGRNHDFEYRMIAADGRVVWLRDIVNLTADQPPRVHGVIVDVTANRQVNLALQASYQQVSDLAASLITAKEVERARIARELHDGISQQLAAASMRIRGLKEGAPLPLQKELDCAYTMIDQAIDTVRNLSHELHPAALRHGGLISALISHCNEFRRQYGLQVVLAVEDIKEIRGEAAVGLFRIAQEALHNVIKHAQARTVRIAMRRIEDQIELTVEDDGCGFDREQFRYSASLGLISIDERVRIMRGTAVIDSALGSGTRLSVRVPVQIKD